MICPFCGGSGVNETWVATDAVSEFKQTCFKCHGTGKIEQTNEEWLKQCNTEQLAEVLNKIFMTRTFCHICPEGGVCDIGYKCKYHGGKVEDFVEWLKQPHTTKE